MNELATWVGRLQPWNEAWLLGLGPSLLLLAALLGAESQRATLNQLVLDLARRSGWGPRRAFLLGMRSAAASPLRGALDREAVALLSTGRVDVNGAASFGLGAGVAPTLVAGLALLPVLHAQGIGLLAAFTGLGLLLTLASGRPERTHTGRLLMAWCVLAWASTALVTSAAATGWDLSNHTGDWTRECLAGLALGTLLSCLGLPRVLLVVSLGALTQLGLAPVHGLLAVLVGPHLVRAVLARRSRPGTGERAHRVSLRLHSQAALAAAVAYGLWVLAVDLQRDHPHLPAEPLLWVAAFEAANWLGTVLLWALFARRDRDPGLSAPDPQEAHAAVELPSMVVLGAEDIAQRMGRLALELTQELAVQRPKAVQRRTAGPTPVQRQAQELRRSLDALAARWAPQEASQGELDRLLTAQAATRERAALVELLLRPELLNCANPPEALAPHLKADLLARTRAVQGSLRTLTSAPPLTNSELECLDASLEDLYTLADTELERGGLTDTAHNLLGTQLEARRRLAVRAARVAEEQAA